MNKTCFRSLAITGEASGATGGGGGGGGRGGGIAEGSSVSGSHRLISACALKLKCRGGAVRVATVTDAAGERR
ncbi:hypothetical protein E2C01_100249 [Portunus trituberculatus]|uniref:Uncharacterized protein n=1 Tax=Portunus trituberculatus TaxID=210409 RepID=A0A5B7KIY3_PORTR|nr:hypothetical protein [Portunus trituberculatus]